MIHSIWWFILALFLLSHTIGQKLQPTQTIDDPSKNRQCETLRTNSSDSILFIGLVRNNKLLIILKNFHLFEIPFSDNETKQINLVGEKTVPFSERFDSLHQDDRFRQLYEKQYIQTSFTMNWRNRLRIIFSIENYQSKSNIEYYFDWNLVSTNRFEAKNLHPDFDEKFAEKKIKRIFPLSSSQQNHDDSILFLILKDDFHNIYIKSIGLYDYECFFRNLNLFRSENFDDRRKLSYGTLCFLDIDKKNVFLKKSNEPDSLQCSQPVQIDIDQGFLTSNFFFLIGPKMVYYFSKNLLRKFGPTNSQKFNQIRVDEFFVCSLSKIKMEPSKSLTKTKLNSKIKSKFKSVTETKTSKPIKNTNLTSSDRANGIEITYKNEIDTKKINEIDLIIRGDRIARKYILMIPIVSITILLIMLIICLYYCFGRRNKHPNLQLQQSFRSVLSWIDKNQSTFTLSKLSDWRLIPTAPKSPLKSSLESSSQSSSSKSSIATRKSVDGDKKIHKTIPSKTSNRQSSSSSSSSSSSTLKSDSLIPKLSNVIELKFSKKIQTKSINLGGENRSRLKMLLSERKQFSNRSKSIRKGKLSKLSSN